MPERQTDRRWMAHRQAYAPPGWHGLLLGIVIAAPLWYLLLHPHDFVLLSACGGISGGAGGTLGTRFIWWHWRRKHPVLPVKVWMAQQARWN